MIAYNRTSLDNRDIRKQADEAIAAGCITPDEKDKISEAHPVDLYGPNIFICIGLFLLTVLIAMCTLGLFTLMADTGMGSLISLLFFFGLICYGALEFIIYKRHHFRSGVDYALMWMSASLLYSACFMIYDNMSAVAQCMIVFTISLLFVLRFANSIMALVVYAALFGFILSVGQESGRTAHLFTPFVLMMVSVAAWFLSDRYLHNEKCRHYRLCLIAIKIAALISFYLAGNYFIVREMLSFAFGHARHPGTGMSMSWLYWLLTIATPLLYIYMGIRKKDHIFLWMGLALTAATVCTIRYYYSVLPAEWAMMIGGIIVIGIAFKLIRFLKTPIRGITSLESSNKQLLENLNIESLVIAETFAGTATAPVDANGFQFGGGSGGGGGAGGQY